MTSIEKKIEQAFSKSVERHGGISVKMGVLHFSGLPDRMALLPGGVMFFAEIKDRGEKPKAIQALVHRKIRALGFEVIVIDDESQIAPLLQKFTNLKVK